MSLKHIRGSGSLLVLAAGAAALVLPGCTHTVKVEPIKVEPIDITLHIHLEADQKLDEFFNEVEAAPKKTEPTTQTQMEGAKP